MSYKSRPIRRAWPLIFIVSLVVLVLSLSSSAYLVRRSYTHNLLALDQGGVTVQKTFTVEKGATAKQVANSLFKNGIIRKSWAFEWYMRSHNLRDKIQAGTYVISPSQTTAQIAQILTEGKIKTDLLTILPASRLDLIKDKFLSSGFTAAEVDSAFLAKNYANHPALIDKPATSDLEGYLYPDSYQRIADTKPSEIITGALDQFLSHVKPEIRAGIAKQGLTIHQAVILASIVEQEENKLVDRPTVAQVFLKRLKLNMQLGSDVTAFYGSAKDGKPQLKDVFYDSPYNTRIHNGLPPGPIGNVSEGSLRAVAEPSGTDYLYFVAGDDGKTYFSNTIEEHEDLTAKHCIKLCK